MYKPLETQTILVSRRNSLLILFFSWDLLTIRRISTVLSFKKIMVYYYSHFMQIMVYSQI